MQERDFPFGLVSKTDPMISELPFSAFVLAGGLGTRLRGVVSDRPKPLAPVDGIPFLEILLNALAAKGVREFILLTGYKGEMIEQHFRSLDKPGLTIRCSPEEIPLGTGGAVKNAARFATDPSLLVNGDTFFDADLESLLRFHGEHRADATLSLLAVEDVSRYGSVFIDHTGMITRFCEKDEGKTGPGLINAGVSLLDRDFIHSLPDGPFSMERDIFPSLAGSNRMFGLCREGVFYDIGTPESYEAFTAFVRGHREMFSAL
jgi:D-glycero-alpha-D-manno-heptose 1-phosphate guanylyltransferase